MQEKQAAQAGLSSERDNGRAGGDAEKSAGDVPRRVLAYVARFDRGEFWLAHEEMEEHWQENGEDLYKGLIQVAAGFLHAERENWNGARRLLTTALEYLEPYPATVEGFDLSGIRRVVGRALERFERCAAGEDLELDGSLRFPMSRYFGPKVPAGVVEDEELPYRVRRYDRGYRPYGGRQRAERTTGSGGADGDGQERE